MNRPMIVAEWQRATESLRAADTLAREGLRADAVSRAYYAILHATKAALHVQDVAAERHAAVRRMFGLHLVQAGEIEREWPAYLAEGPDDRLGADYDATVQFSEEEANAECARATAFLERMRTYLLQKGLTAEDLKPRPTSA